MIDMDKLEQDVKAYFDSQYPEPTGRLISDLWLALKKVTDERENSAGGHHEVQANWARHRAGRP
jgi:hypothetical protein